MTSALLLPLAGAPAPPPALQRARGRARVSFRRDGEAIRLVEFHQEGCCKVRLPRVEPGLPPEAVLLNTAGGITGGDHLIFEVAVGDQAQAVATTQAAERIYKRSSGVGRVENHLSVGVGAHLDWLPQETILFDRSALSRSLDVDLDEGASALLVETVVFGRGAMGETIRSVTLSDRWRVRREGRLIFADGIVIDGNAVETMASGATAGGAVAVATLLFAAEDAASRLEIVRAALAEAGGEAAASAWPGILTTRFIAPDSRTLRQDMIRVIEALRERSMPRVWQC